MNDKIDDVKYSDKEYILYLELNLESTEKERDDLKKERDIYKVDIDRVFSYVTMGRDSSTYCQESEKIIKGTFSKIKELNKAP